MAPAAWALDPGQPRFFVPPDGPTLLLTLRDGPMPSWSGPAFRVGELARIWRDRAAWTFAVGPAGDADRTAVLHAGGTGLLLQDLAQDPALASRYPLAYPLDDLVFRHLLPDRASVIVHAAGIAWRGQGLLFVGSSGAGKSTMARLWQAAGAQILNDDRILLESRPDGIWMHPTPWSGEYPEVTGTAVPLAKAFLIRHGWPIALEPIRPARTLALLYAKSFPPLWDAEGVSRTLAVLESVCRQVPCGWLTVPPDERAVAWVRARLPA
jgi:hypothetical protein